MTFLSGGASVLSQTRTGNLLGATNLSPPLGLISELPREFTVARRGWCSLIPGRRLSGSVACKPDTRALAPRRLVTGSLAGCSFLPSRESASRGGRPVCSSSLGGTPVTSRPRGGPVVCEEDASSPIASDFESVFEALQDSISRIGNGSESSDSSQAVATAVLLSATAAFVFLCADSALAADVTTAAAASATTIAASGDAISPATWTNPFQQVVAAIEQGGDAAGPLGGAVYFAAAYALAAVLLIPASILTLAAGYLFGAARGTAITLFAATVGASAAFLIARYAARPFVSRQLAGRLGEGKFEALDRAISVGGWRIVALCRLSPIFPFSISNYVFGITGIGFLEYTLASSIGMLPATFAYVYLGGAGRVAVDAVTTSAVVTASADGAAAAAQSGLDPVQVGLYVVGAVATVLVTREVSTRASKALEEAAAQGAPAAAAGDAAVVPTAAAGDTGKGKGGE